MPKNLSAMMLGRRHENSGILHKKKIFIKPQNKDSASKNIFTGGMVDRIANVPAGCGSCGGAR
jgi:hypothetical protein